MRVISCDCFDEVGFELEENKEEETFNANKTETIILKDGTGSYEKEVNIEGIRFCPFCGKKIEVSDD